MPYRYLNFDGLTLPTAKPIDDLSSAMSEAAIIQAINGTVDALGTSQAQNKTQPLEYTALHINNDGLLIAQAGDQLVTEDGDNLWTGSETTQIVDGWRRLRGKRGALIRQRDWDGEQHWKYARLLQFEAKREVQHADVVLPMRFLFELADGSWRELAESTVTAALGDTVQTDFTVTVGGTETVTDCVIEITADDYITGIDIEVGSDQMLQWAYASPPVFPGETIIFDCGRFTVTEDGASRYVGFNLGVPHAIQNWIELEPGDNTISITLNGGGADCVVRYYNQYV